MDIISIFSSVAGLEELIVFLVFIVLPLVILCSSRSTCSFEESAWKEITEDDDKNEHPNDDKK